MSGALPASFAIDAATARVRLDQHDPAFVADPYVAFAATRALGPAFFWEDHRLWCFTEAEAVNALLRDRRLGREILHVATREELGMPEEPAHTRPFYDLDRLTMLSREPPAHTRLRTLVNRAFVSRQIERLRPRIATLCHRLIDGFEAAGSVDLIAAFATPIPVTIIAEMMGVPVDMAPQLLDWSHRMVAMYQFGRSTETELSAVAATEAFVGFLRGYVAERRGAPADDLISVLIAAEADGERLSEDELIASCILLLNAGHEATVHSIGNAVKAILESGLDTAGWFARPGGPEAVAEEALRFDPPLHLFQRYVLEPCEIAGIAFSKGDSLGLLLGAANRDAARFADPDRFDPARPVRPHLAFGAGIHFCIGAPLARLELEVALPILFERLPRLALAGAPRYRDSWHFHGLERLDVAW
ncbi:cytochrome P450 [Prosthecomicrobium pneumaticum]|uniref:Cytochrome P450 n=1 Tax=Prosthecomicrobium pneumaticum TaxID=81895 RepID=A0A7W9FQQ4_9HYPH|nr:cytochrome P450 [Prosthecomicrobium pneumaticum]MBB5755070.1 cytochrome P450 [Prosthecomicrobium pneumaticum]